MNVSDHQVILAVLWAAPVIQTLATAGLLALAWRFRHDLGAPAMPIGALGALGVVTIALHAGYFLAPHLWSTGRQLLGAATMLPVALAVLGALAAMLAQTGIGQVLRRAAVPKRLVALVGAGALVLAYVGPLVLMLAASA